MTNIASRQHASIVRETTKVPREHKTASAKAIWIAKCKVSNKARSLDKASGKANSTFHKAQPRLSHEAKAKAPLDADSVPEPALFPLPALSAKKVLSSEARTTTLNAKDLSREAKDEAPLSANSEAEIASLKEKSLLCRAKLTFKGRAKIVASQVFQAKLS